MSENIDLSFFFGEFYELLPADYAKGLIKVKDQNKNKEIVADIENRLSGLKDKIWEIDETEKKNKNADETSKIIEEILDFSKKVQKVFSVASRVDKGTSEPKSEESIAKRVVLRRGMVAKIKREEKI